MTQWIFQLTLTFFGLGLDYKPMLHSEIHSIVWYGRGGYNWETVYNWPIWLRRFYAKKIKEYIEAEAKAQKDATEKSSKSKGVSKPNIRPKVPVKR